MGKSFVLRDQTGRPAGYLLQEMQTMRCRFSGAEEGMEIILLHADGNHSRRGIAAYDNEIKWEEAVGALDGAVIIKGDAIAASSGMQAIRRFEGLQIGPMDRKRQTDASAPDAIQSCRQQMPEEITKREENSQRHEIAYGNHLPERRWPCPPCWKEAVYDHGMWIQQH